QVRGVSGRGGHTVQSSSTNPETRWKSRTFRVTRVAEWCRAVAAMRRSRAEGHNRIATSKLCRASHPLCARSPARPNQSSDGEMMRGEAAGVVAPQVRADPSVDGTDARNPLGPLAAFA